MAQQDAPVVTSQKYSDFRYGGGGPGGWNDHAGRGGSLRETGGLGFLLSRAQELKLDDGKQEKLHKLQVSFELEKIDKLAAMHKAKVMLRALMRDHDATEHDVLDAIDKLSACEAELRKMRYYHRKSAWEHLDTDQRAYVAKHARRPHNED